MRQGELVNLESITIGGETFVPGWFSKQQLEAMYPAIASSYEITWIDAFEVYDRVWKDRDRA